MTSKTKIDKRLKQKKNPELVETLIKLKKKNPEIAKIFARPIKRWMQINLDKIKGEKVLVGGKVLGDGELKEKSKIIAWNASAKALEKIKKFGGKFISLKEAVDKNIELKDFKILR